MLGSCSPTVSREAPDASLCTCPGARRDQPRWPWAFPLTWPRAGSAAGAQAGKAEPAEHGKCQPRGPGVWRALTKAQE